MKKLDELKALMAKATPGPWTLDKSRMVLGSCFTGELKSICDKVRGGNPEQADANAFLISEIPNILPALIAAVEALKELSTWQRPSKRDWENGAVQDEFDTMQNKAREALKPFGE